MITFDSIHETFVTFGAGDGLQPGQVCKITENGTVGPCEAGDGICGVARSVRLGMAGVVMTGFVTRPYSGEVPTLGRVKLCADGKGGVKVGGDTAYTVVKVVEGAGLVGFFL